jgi:hypothetical protein
MTGGKKSQKWRRKKLVSIFVPQWPPKSFLLQIVMDIAARRRENCKVVSKKEVLLYFLINSLCSQQWRQGWLKKSIFQ